MARILITGGNGHMGRRAVRALLHAGHEIVIGDRQGPAIEPAASFIELDINDAAALAAACADVDAVLNFVGPYYRFGTTVAAAAIAAGRPYVDVCDDADVTEDLLELDAAAKEAGVPVVVGAGMSPGIINAVAQAVAAEFDQIDEILTAWIVDEHSESGPAPLDHFFHGIADDIPIWRNSQREVIRPFTQDSAEVFPFPEPLGPIEVRDVGHPEPVTLPRAVEATEVRNKGALLPPQSGPIFKMLAGIGLLGDTTVEVRGTAVRARDFIVAYLTQRHNERGVSTAADRAGMGVRVRGTRRGEAVVKYVGYAAAVTMADSTALPAAAAMEVMLSNDLPAGVNGPEVLGPERWFDALGRIDSGLFDELRVWEGDVDDETAPPVPLAALPLAANGTSR